MRESEIPFKKRASMKRETVEDSSLVSRAKRVFLNPIHEEASTLISHLLLQQENQENRSARTLYRFCFAFFPNSLSRMLLKMYIASSPHKPETASKSISLLRALLTCLSRDEITPPRCVISLLKPLVVSCLVAQGTPDSDIEDLSRVLSLVAAHVFEWDNDGWDELSVCIVSVADHDLRRALRFFRDLPPVYESFLICILQGLFTETLTLLLQDHGDAEDWSLALQTGFKMATQLLDTTRSDLVGNILYAILTSARKLVTQEKEDVLGRGLEELETMMRGNVYKYDRGEYKFVMEFVSMMERMRGTGEETKVIARRISQIDFNFSFV